jgi:SAM-dependent methyltransferase
LDAADWDARYAATDLVWSSGPNRWVEELLGDVAPGRVVDIAGGEGRNGLWLASRGWDVLVTDYSPVAIERARERAEKLPPDGRFRAEVADATAPVADPPYDVALLCYLQLPGEQFATALRHASAALVPGGRLVVVGHALANLTDGTGGPQDPDVLYDPDRVTAALEGLRVDVAEIRERPVEGAPRPALDTVVTAIRD